MRENRLSLSSSDDPGTAGVDEAGFYQFDTLTVGTYTLRVEGTASWFTTNASSTNVTLTLESTGPTSTLLGVEPNLTSISGLVFSDLNSNQIQEAGDLGRAGVVVFIDRNLNGILDATETSQSTRADDPATIGIDESGTYEFGLLPLGSSRVRVQLPGGFIASGSLFKDATLTTSNSTASNVNIAIHENLTSVSGILFNDLNGNGAQDGGEGPRAGLVVYVDTNRNGVRDTGEPNTTSAADGSYMIANVSPGNRLVRVVTVGPSQITSPTFQTERLFVSSGTTLREINATTGSQISSFSVSPVQTRGATSGGLAFDGSSVFMIDRVDNRILVIDPNTGVVTRTLGPLPNSFYGGLAFVNSLLYASDNTNERILAINPNSGAIVSTFNIATLNVGTPFYSGTIDLLDGLGESADGTRLIAGTATLQRLIINPATGIVEGAYTDLPNQRDLGLAGANGKIFVGRRDSNSIEVYNAAGTLTATLANVSLADDVAASTIVNRGANLTLTLDQQVTGVNFGIGSTIGTISGRQYNDLNQSGTFDAGDVPLAGVTVFVDANNNDWPDASERSAISAADGTYTITNVTQGQVTVRAISPANYRPASSYPTTNRLFATSLVTGSSFVRLRELDPITGAIIRSTDTTIFGTTSSEIEYDGKRILLIDSGTNFVTEFAPDGTVLDQVPLNTSAVTDFGPVVIGGEIFSLRGPGLSLSLMKYDPDTNQFIFQRPITFNWDLAALASGGSTVLPSFTFVSGPSADGASILLGTTDDRVLTIDPKTGIANFSVVPTSTQLVDNARAAIGGEHFESYANSINVFNAAGTLLRTMPSSPYLGLGAGVYRDIGTSVNVVGGQANSNVDLRFASTRSTLSGTVTQDANANQVNDAGDSPISGTTVYLDLNRNSTFDAGEPQTLTNAQGRYQFSDLTAGEYVVRQLPASNSTSQAWVANYNRLFTRTIVNSIATISELDPITGQILRQFPSPGTNSFQSGLALRGDTLYMSQSGSLYALDANTGMQRGTTPLPTGLLDGLAILSDKAYVLNSSNNTILVVDLTTKLFERTIDVQAANPTIGLLIQAGLGESADGQNLAARNGGDTLIIDPVTGVIVTTLVGTFPGNAIAGAGGETFDQGHFVNSIQQSTEARDRLGLIRRRLPWTFGVTANGYAAANVQATEHRVRIFAEQSLTNLNFGNVASATISGTQYVDVNQSGTFDAGDTPLAGVTVFADINNDHFPNAGEPQAITASDGSYTLTNFPESSVVVRAVVPNNFAPTGTSISSTRLFGSYRITDSASPTGFRLGVREFNPSTGVLVGETATAIPVGLANSITYDSDSLIVTDTVRRMLIQLTTAGPLIAEVPIPSAQPSDSIIGVVNVNESIYVMTRTTGNVLLLHKYDSRTRTFQAARTVTQTSGPSLSTAGLDATLSESPDGRSILAFSNARSSVLVIDPISATLVKEVPTSNYSSLRSGATAYNGELTAVGTTNSLRVFDGEFNPVRILQPTIASTAGLGGGNFKDFGKIAVVTPGAQLIGFNQSYRSTLPSDGQLDREFGVDGITTTEFFSNSLSFDESQALAIDNLGRTVTVGTGGHIRRHNADGSLDTTFGTNGFAPFPGGAVDVAINSNNQIIVAGSQFTGSGFQFLVARYLADGSLDRSFGNQGIQQTAFSDVRANASALTLQPDGKIVVVGVGSDASVTYRDVIVARYLPSGALDLSFSGDGKASASINAFDYANDVAILEGSDILIAGSTLAGATYDIALWRFNSTGSLNTNFDGDGIRTIDFTGTDDEAYGVAVSSANVITVVGYTKVGSYTDTAIAQVNASGALITSFDGDGRAVTNVGSGDDRANAVVIDSLGRIVVTGFAGSPAAITNVTVLRYNTNGSLDTTFDTDGIATTDIASRSDVGHDIAINSSGQIIVAGSADLQLSPSNYDALLVRYNSDGSLDTNYQTTGKVTTPIRNSTDEAYSIALQPDGKSVVAGSSRNSANLDFALARYDAFGKLDPSFGSGGRVITPIGSGDDIARQVIVRGDGKLIAVGRSRVGSNWNIAIAQYTSGGTLDTSFGTGGIVTTDLGSSEDDAFDVVLDANQRIVVVGQRLGSGLDIVIARYLPAGLLDISFGTAGIANFSLGSSTEVPAGVLLQSDGKIVVGGFTNLSGGFDFLVARFLTGGTLDTSFDVDGWATIDFGSTNDYVQSIALNHVGGIVAAGTRESVSGLDFAIAQLTSNGALDTSFGTGGKTTTDFLGGTDVIRRVRVADDAKLVVAGYSNDPAKANFDFAIARYTATGQLDATFEGDGKTRTAIGAFDDIGNDFVIDGKGDFVVAGSAITGSGHDFAIARYLGPPPADVVLDGSNLLVRHSNPTNRTIRFDGTNLVVIDSSLNLTTPIASASGTGSTTITIPLSSFTGGVVYRSGDGNQTLTLDLSLASLSRPITIFAESGQDQLVVSGGSAAIANVSFATANSGQLVVSGNSTIDFSGISAVGLITATQNVTTTYPDLSSVITLDSPAVGQVRQTHSNAPTLTVASPSQSLIVNGGSDADTFVLTGLPSGFAADLSIVGGLGFDTVTSNAPITLAGGDLTINADSITLNAEVATGGGNLDLSASGNISIHDSSSTQGGRLSLNADSDANGVGVIEVRPGLVSVQPQSLFPTDGGPFDWSGGSVAVSGDWMFTSSRNQFSGPFQQGGAAYAYRRINGSWTQVQKIVPSDVSNSFLFAERIAIDGNVAAFSALGATVDGVTLAGAIYVYRNINGVWTFEQKLIADDNRQQRFGDSLAILGDTIVAGATLAPSSANPIGAVYIFNRTANGWSQSQRLVATDTITTTQFGYSVALDNNVLVIGTPFNPSGGSLGGDVYVFNRANGVWSQSQKLSGPNPTGFRQFGRSVDIDGDYLAVGASHVDIGTAADAGSAYVYQLLDGQWVLQSELINESPIPGGGYGTTISISGQSVLVGELGNSTFTNPFGAVHAFISIDEQWYERAVFTGSPAGAGSNFALSLDHDGNTAVVGSFLSGAFGAQSGASFVYDLSALTPQPFILNAGSGEINLTAADIVLLGQLQSTGPLTIQSSNAAYTIGLGGASGGLRLSDTELSQLRNGFSSITLGGLPGGVGTTTIRSTTYADPVVIKTGNAIALEVEIIEPAGMPQSILPLIVDGSFQIEPGVTLSLVPIGTPLSAEQLTIVRRSGGTGAFASAPEGHRFINPFGNGQNFQLTYAGGDGDDIALIGESAPTDISLSHSSINENVNTSAADLLFANLSAIDSYANDNYSFALVPGGGDNDNSSFTITGNQLQVRQGVLLNYETKPAYNVRVRVSDGSGLAFEKSLVLAVNDLVEINKSNITINDGSNQRSRVDSLTIQFDSPVVLQAGALKVTQRSSGSPVAGIVVSPPIGTASQTFTITFEGNLIEFQSLADGNYELEIDATKVTNLSGFQLDTNKDGQTGDNFVFGNDSGDRFFRLFGDSNGDRDVDALDFILFRRSLNVSPGSSGYASYFDERKDNDVDTLDLLAFRRRLNVSFTF